MINKRKLGLLPICQINKPELQLAGLLMEL